MQEYIFLPSPLGWNELLAKPDFVFSMYKPVDRCAALIKAKCPGSALTNDAARFPYNRIRLLCIQGESF